MGNGIADYVLIYPKKHELSYQVQEYIRKVQEDGCLTVEEEELTGGDEILVKILAPFTELSKAAESLRLCMPLLSDAMSRSETAVLQTKEFNGCYTVNKDHWKTIKNLWSCFMQRFETEPDDELVSAVYTDNEGLFEVIDDKDSFFRPSLRYLLKAPRYIEMVWMKSKPSKFRSISIIKGNLAGQRFYIGDEAISTVSEKPVKSLGRTVFLEIWKRKNASLSHKWKVKDYERNEPDRPEFKGILTKKDLVTGDEVPYYPTSYRYTKIFASFSVLLVLIFAACFPLGPLLFFFTLLVDKKVDSKRLLWIFRRPLPWIAQDIGPWFSILEIINAVAVVTNACLIAFSSQFGIERPLVEQLMIFIIFELFGTVAFYLCTESVHVSRSVYLHRRFPAVLVPSRAMSMAVFNVTLVLALKTFSRSFAEFVSNTTLTISSSSP
ncbi:ANO9 protein, partial [Polypterus senegalus]